MQQDFGTIIYLAVPNSRLRSPPGVFASKFTVRTTQEYEIQFARIGSHETQSVFRRYRQFYQLYRATSSLGFAEPPDVKFPHKQILHSLKAQVVSYRRTQLEQWLRFVAGCLHCHSMLYEFLGVAGSQPLEACLQNFGELCVTNAIHRLMSEPHMKLGTLEYFDQRFFPRAVSLRADYILVFLTFLFPIISDDHAGSRALRVLRSLISRKLFKGAGEVIRTMPQLSRDMVKKARLDTHIIERWFHDTREDACEIFKVLYEECASQGPDIVLDLVLLTQLNESQEALALFQAWYTNRDSEGRLEPVVNETPWSEKMSPDGDISVKFRAVGRIVESETQIKVAAPLARVMDVILSPDLRRLWDLRVTKCVFTATESENCFMLDIELESGGKTHPFPGQLKITRESDSRVIICYESSNGLLRTSYEITSLHSVPSRESAMSSQIIPRFEETDSADWSTPRFRLSVGGSDCDQCMVVVRNWGGEAVAKLFVPDLLGEGNLFMSTWVKFKMIAEGDQADIGEEDRDGSLNEALSRKTLRSLSSGRRRTTEGLEASHLTHRKLERRMFLS